MKKRTFFLAFLLVGIVLSVVGVQAWALSAPELQEQSVATVTVDEGEAFIGTGGDWRPVSVDSVVTAGDHVKTNARSQATINFFDGASARLDAQTELVIDKASADPMDASDMDVALTVVSGRMWSRIVKFLDPESSYTVHSSSVVATVRGTAFVTDVTDPLGDMVTVVDGQVGVAGQDEVIAGEPSWEQMTPGEEAWMAKQPERRQREGVQRRQAGARLDSPWFKKMRSADEQFLETVRRDRNRILQERGAILPGTLRYPLRRLGERVRLALTTNPEHRQELALGYANRRFAEAMLLGRANKTEASTRTWKVYMSTLHKIERDSRSPASRVTMIERMTDAERSVYPVDHTERSGLPAYLDRELATDSEFGQLLARLRGERVEWRLQRPEIPTSRTVNDNPPSTDAVPTATPTNTNTPVNTNSNTNANTNTPVTPITPRLSLIVPRTILSLPDTQQLRAMFTASDGTERDVTNEAVWTVSGDPAIGVVSRGFLTTTQSGTGVVQAGYQGLTATANIRVTQPPDAVPTATLERITVTPSSAVVSAGGSASFRAVAGYSDGSNKDVTTSAVWSVYSASMGAVSAGLLQTTPNSYGSGPVTASYSEGGRTVQGSATVSVGSAG